MTPRYKSIITRQEYTFETGLGTGLGLLSVICAGNRKAPVVLNVNRTNHWLFEIMDIIKPLKSRIYIKHTPEFDEFMVPLNSKQLGDSIKFFAPYIDINEVELYGKTFPLGATNKEKKCIGIIMSNGRDGTPEAKANNSHPYHRYYEPEVYFKIMKLCMDAGYDVITLDSPNVDLQDKIYQISQMCDCVIGYEGGMMHLAHILKTPTIILPWHHLSHGEPPSDFSYFDNKDIPAVKYVAHMYHLDKMSYFPESPEDILKWSPHILKGMIETLRKGLGNNYFLKNRLSYFQKEYFFDAQFSTFEKSFIKQYIGDLYVAGDPNL